MAVFGAGGVGLNVVVGARLAGAARIVVVDHAFEVVGEPTVMEQALSVLAPAGELVLVGAAARDTLMSFHPRAFLSKQQRITGCIYGSARPHEDLPALLRWCADGTIPVADLIGRRVTLEELESAFDEPADGGVRTLVTFG